MRLFGFRTNEIFSPSAAPPQLCSPHTEGGLIDNLRGKKKQGPGDRRGNQENELMSNAGFTYMDL